MNCITIQMKGNVSDATSSSTIKDNFSLYQVSSQTHTSFNASSFYISYKKNSL